MFRRYGPYLLAQYIDCVARAMPSQLRRTALKPVVFAILSFVTDLELQVRA